MVRITGIETGSIAEELQLEVGTRIVRINGHPVRDGIDLTFLLADSELNIEIISPSGQESILEIEREEGEVLGIEPAPDTVRECANDCVFCFVDGNPEAARPSLWLRDDDFRLSFTYGSYVTLTNLGPKSLERLTSQNISPLYVSVHSTDPELRIRLLNNDRAGSIMEQLRFLVDGGLEVYTQAVICPGWNDGHHLERTMEDLFGLGEGILTLSVVPVGLTRYNLNQPVRCLSPQEASEAISMVDGFQLRARRARGVGWVYAADEMYLSAGVPLPPMSHYDSWDLTENGVGGVSRFLTAFEEGIEDVPSLEGHRIRILTSRSMAPFMRKLSPRISGSTGAEVLVHEVTNEFFGETVTVAGLLGGRELLGAIENPQPKDIILLPGEALNTDDVFIDSFSLGEFRKGIAPGHLLPAMEITEALRSL